MSASLSTVLSGLSMGAFWTQMSDVFAIPIVVGLVLLGIALKYGKRILRFIRGA